MIWTALSAIGTVLAAFVGIAGIWINLWDRKKRLKVSFETIPYFHIYLCNNSIRSVAITKMVCSVGKHVFYALPYNGLQEVCLSPASVQKLEVRAKDIYNDYYKNQMNVFCNPKDEIIIVLHDNYGRKYMIKTGFGIAAFK